MITISSRQFGALEAAMLDASRRRVAAFLRGHAADDVAALGDDDLAARVRLCEQSGLAHGLASERAQAIWALLMVRTDRAIEAEPFLGHLRDPSYPSPDEALYALFDAMADEAAAAGPH